ncbi:MAG: NAD(P)/FAD-dependent oxidoreductase [Candidatus Brocadiia bacterium]|jgi:protoporphyrinogen oxidase
MSRNPAARRAALCALLLLAAAAASGATPDREPAEKPHDVIIVGAGLAGLTAAFYLKNYDIVVLEKEGRPGGKAISYKVGDFSCAMGAEYIGKPTDEIGKIVRALKLTPVQIPSPMDAAWQDGELYLGETGIASLFVRRASVGEYNRFVSAMQEFTSEYEEIPRLDPDSELAALDDISAKDWLNRMKFPEIFLQRYNVAARGIFGANLGEISALCALPEIAFDYEDARLIKDNEKLANETGRGRRATEAYTFKTGLTELTDALAADLGDRLRLNAAVLSVRTADGRCEVTYRDAKAGERTISARVVILAVAAPAALKIAGDELGDEQRELLAKIPYSSYATVSFTSKTPIFDRAFDLAAPDGLFFTDIYDATWVQRFCDPDAKNAAGCVTTVYIPPESYADPKLMRMTDDEILAAVRADLERVLPGSGAKIVASRVERFPHAFPVMTLGAHKRLMRLHEITLGRLLLAGDYMVYPTFEGAAKSGYLAARKAIAALQKKR